jgi:hypothetical protein
MIDLAFLTEAGGPGAAGAGGHPEHPLQRPVAGPGLFDDCASGRGFAARAVVGLPNTDAHEIASLPPGTPTIGRGPVSTAAREWHWCGRDCAGHVEQWRALPGVSLDQF